MVAGAIQTPENLPKRVLDGDIDYDSDAFRLVYLTADPTSALNADDTYSSISATEVPNGNGYTTHGWALITSTSKVGATATFLSTGSQVLSASGDINGIDWAAIVDCSITGLTTEADAGDIVVGFFELNSGSDFDMSSGDVLTTTLGDIYDLT